MPASTPPTPPDDLSPEALEAQLEEVLDDLHELSVTDPEAALECHASLPPEVREHPQAQLALGRALFMVEGARAALPVFEAVLAQEPDSGDVHHALGMLYEELENTERQRHHYLETLRLDTELDADDEIEEEVREYILKQTVDTVQALPPEFKDKLRHVPVVIEDRPAIALVSEGFDPRSYGLFEGLDHGAELNAEASDTPTRVVLFAANLLADFPDEEELNEEIRLTVLHEIGHYFGLDEADMERLGLD